MLSQPQALNRADIARRIPHQGRMCLLDTVTVWDSEQIHCQTHSHQAPDHPLRAYGRLGAACGVEYAAQAMAVHGTLVAENLFLDSTDSAFSRVGYLASLRSLTLYVDRLDTVAGPLTISAQRISADASTVLYSFTVQASGPGGAKTLLAGRAAVVLDAAGISSNPENSKQAHMSGPARIIRR